MPSMNREDYLAAGKKAAFNIWEWGHAHTFTAGLICGGVGWTFLWPIAKALIFK